MVQKRVLFVAEAVTLAHVGRSLTLAKGLDRIRYLPLFAWDDRFNKTIGPLPGPWSPLWSVSTETFLDRIYRGQPVYDFDTLDRYVRDDLALFRTTKPAAIVGDARLSLRVSAAVAGIPYLNVINAHWSPYARTRWIVPCSSIVDKIGPSWGQRFFDLLRPLYFRAYAKGFNALLKKWGQPRLEVDLRQVYCAGDRTLYPDLPDLVPTKNLPPTHRFLGPVAWSPDVPLAEELARPIKGKKTIYIALGTSGPSNALPTILSGLSKHPLRIFISLGNSSPIHNPAPDRLDIHVAPFFSGQAATEAADLVIHNGGSGSINQCLLAGVPFIGVASNLDQFSCMYFPEQAGIGTTLRADTLSPSAVDRATNALLEDPRWRQNIKALQLRAQEFNPSKILADELDNLPEPNGSGL